MVTKTQKQERCKDYTTRHAKLEQEFIRLFRHNWDSDGGSVRPVGLGNMPIRELEHLINSEKKTLGGE